MERKNQRISDLFYNNRFLLVFSVVAAVALWLVVAVEYGPEITKDDVEVTVDADFSYLESLGLTYFGDYDKTINVKIKGQRIVVESDDIKNQISAKLQTGSVTGAGTYPLVINVSKTVDSSGEFEIIGSTAAPFYNLYFDKKAQRDFFIEPQIEFEGNNNSDDYYILDSEKYNIEPNKITVSGPATYVARIEKVVAKAKVKNVLKQTASVQADLQLIDSDGNALDPKLYHLTLTATESSVTIPVYKIQNMKMGYSRINRPAKYIKEQYDPFKVTFNPPNVKAAVSEASLNVSNELEVIEIDYSKLHRGVNTFEVSASDIDGCVFLDGTEKITVVVDTGDVDTLTVSAPDISAVNFEMVPEGRKVSPVSIDFENVTMVGPAESIEQIDTSKLKIRVNMSEITEDTKGEIQIRAFAETDDCWSYGEDYFVTVNVE